MDHKIILNQILNNNCILYELLKEEAEDDELLFNLTNQKRNQISPLFSRRKSEGFFEKLIKGHLSTVMTTDFKSFFVSIASNLILFYHWLESRLQKSHLYEFLIQ